MLGAKGSAPLRHPRLFRRPPVGMILRDSVAISHHQRSPKVTNDCVQSCYRFAVIVFLPLAGFFEAKGKKTPWHMMVGHVAHPYARRTTPMEEKDCIMSIWYADDGNATVAGDFENGVQAAISYVNTGDWGPIDHTIWIAVHVWQLDAYDERCNEESHKIAIDPEEPKCTKSQHDWQSPEWLGGLKENPGVWGHGAGIKTTEVCIHCGCARYIDTWATDENDGTQGHTSISYEKNAYEICTEDPRTPDQNGEK